MTTQTKTYAGCDPKIAEALKANRSVEGQVRDGLEEAWRNATITHYSEARDEYVAATNFNDVPREYWWRLARTNNPKRIMAPEKAIPILIANGYKYNNEGGLIINKFGEDVAIQPFMFKDMGKLATDSNYTWPDIILEDIE